MVGPVTLRVLDGVGHLELDRPEVGNALNLPLARAMVGAVGAAAEDAHVRSVVLTGAGPRFCVGGDVMSFAAAADRGAHLLQVATAANAAVQALQALQKPVVAAVHGAVAGAGLAVMLACDVIVAHPDTRFVFAYPSIGLTPDCGVSYLLPRAIGQQRALAFALCAQPATALHALEWGLVAEIADHPADRARELAKAMAEGPSRALGQTRRLVRAGWDASPQQVGEDEARTISEISRGEEAEGLIERFLRPDTSRPRDSSK